MKSRIVSLALLLLTALTVLASNDAPNVVNYQGKLLNSAGANVTDGTYTIQFKIYNSASGAGSLWGESHTVVISGGYFNVMLGEGGTAISGSTYTNVTDALGSTTTPYLGLTITADGSGAVNSPSEITPRLRFLSSPYSLIAARSKYADNASQATNAQTLGGLDATRFLQPLSTASTTLNGPLRMTSASLSSTFTVAGASTFSNNVAVTGTLSATTTSGGGFVPVGGIIMWSGNSTGLPD
ncbi:MAG: hypothetical protein JWN25_1864, partial [Verrucomicrobiales bacterium]|nr:hypothetical protein [Verrucomicrobiales bacterium]